MISRTFPRHSTPDARLLTPETRNLELLKTRHPTLGF